MDQQVKSTFQQSLKRFVGTFLGANPTTDTVQSVISAIADSGFQYDNCVTGCNKRYPPPDPRNGPCVQNCALEYGDAPVDQTALPTAFQDKVSPTLSTFRSGLLSDDKQLPQLHGRNLIEAAQVLFQNYYVHLPLKRAMLGIDPIVRCQITLRDMDNSDPRAEVEYMQEVLGIFGELRDLHTTVTLGDPFDGTSFLPFTVDEFYESAEREPIVLVKAVIPGINLRDFKPGVEITHWNGMPIARKIADVAQITAGATPDARRRRAISMLTVRSLAHDPMPEEDWVVITFKDCKGAHTNCSVTESAIHFDWKVLAPPADTVSYENGGPARRQTNPSTEMPTYPVGVDFETLKAQRARYRLFKSPVTKEEPPTWIEPTYSGDLKNIEAGVIKHTDIGYIGLRNFHVVDAMEFVDEVAGILKAFNDKESQHPGGAGLILDVRGNPGGLIPAGELVLQLLTNTTIQPVPVHFLATQATQKFCERDAPLQKWVPSIKRALETGSQFSAGFPVTSPDDMAAVKSKYGCLAPSKIVLLVDAMTYSTACFFAAGFKDHAIGTILGTDRTTGAGGAVRWEYQLLQQVLDNSLRPIPTGAQMSIAMQGAIRAAGQYKDMPFEGLGIEVDHRYELKPSDMIENDQGLINQAVKLITDATPDTAASR